MLALAEDWLAAKRALESAAQAAKGNSDRARRADLQRWADVLGPDLAGLTTERIITAVGLAKARWSDATVDPDDVDAAGLYPLAVPDGSPDRRPHGRRAAPGSPATPTPAEGGQ